MLSIKEAEQREAEQNAALTNGGVAFGDDADEVCALLFGCYYGDALLLLAVLSSAVETNFSVIVVILQFITNKITLFMEITKLWVYYVLFVFIFFITHGGHILLHVMYRGFLCDYADVTVTKVTEKRYSSGEDSLYAVVCGGVLQSDFHHV